MKYVCSVCGYVYDEEKENKLFSDLPDTWACPWCKAPKALFGPKEDGPGEAAAVERPEAVQSGSGEEDALGTGAAGDRMASAGELSVMCSNLARGCEKQYRPEEEALFRQLAEYFAARIPDEEDAGMEQLASMTAQDLAEGYPALSAEASAKADRGTLRICTWGEKVTRIQDVLINRYIKEGSAFLKDTDVWVCSVCGFIYTGDTPPELCPVCKVPDWKFEKMEGRVFG